ncbi:hypothetical protein FWH58_00275 [Candidatus Saccharibacteria bacterium]|nr:hypothetical protein [Candidatus Saccharibacteria bacterium]
MTVPVKRTIRKIASLSAVMAFTGLVISLGITYAVGAGQMEISGQAFFMVQSGLDPLILPIAPTPDGNGDYFTFNATGNGTVQILEQDYLSGDLYLSICAMNSNNGNVSGSFTFAFANPTVYDWTSGSASFVSPWPVNQGGLANNSFTFNSSSVSPTTLLAGNSATVTFAFQAQLGKPATQGSAIITVQYTVAEDYLQPIKQTHIYVKYYPRDATYGCSL